MTIRWLERVDSTQRYLIDQLKKGEVVPPFAVVADVQDAGRGSRGNSWTGLEGNLFFSFAVERSVLPADLKLESSSIYFAFLLKMVLEDAGSEVWLKWPNDFYIGEQKIGGTITTLRQNSLVCGIGLNLKNAPEGFAALDIEISRKKLLDDYFSRVEGFPKWKEIFRLYALEFDKSRRFQTHNNHHKFSLENAVLCDDGSVMCDGQRIYSQR
ncbi:biotin--[acetyl-CoA-carboxylase] ligase [Sulfurimonas diazotrophicus]|uniref:Biotin--[acetyl-CoA-carboxylase] ligase n=1 Tax=Sulfurimonas diazotrophicus TaxID=3131939 RepID=A0ABZ3HCR4_9BACT